MAPSFESRGQKMMNRAYELLDKSEGGFLSGEEEEELRTCLQGARNLAESQR